VETIAGTALSSLETTVVVVIFILLQREDLRNRFIRLAGSRDLQRTTLEMNDAAGRLSRILWGVVAFLLRFVPYFGPLIAAAFPMALAAAIDPGWGTALETLERDDFGQNRFGIPESARV
jgi:predicted PurR-regulated permease PerM